MKGVPYACDLIVVYWYRVDDVFIRMMYFVVKVIGARQSPSSFDLKLLLFHFQVCRIFWTVIVDGE
jgi:hypothetical protein